MNTSLNERNIGARPEKAPDYTLKKGGKASLKSITMVFRTATDTEMADIIMRKPCGRFVLQMVCSLCKRKIIICKGTDFIRKTVIIGYLLTDYVVFRVRRRAAAKQMLRKSPICHIQMGLYISRLLNHQHLNLSLTKRSVQKRIISSDITSLRGGMNITDGYESTSGKSSNFYGI